MNKNKIMAWSVVFLMLFGFVQGVMAADTSTTSPGDIGTRISCVLCKVANLIFLITGALASLVIIIGGLRWLTSAEDPGARNAAKTTIVSAIVGIVIIMIAVFVVALIVNGIMPTAIHPEDWLNPNGCTELCKIFTG
jgi:uncharacterized membrane protein YidH (DUF202 family)